MARRAAGRVPRAPDLAERGTRRSPGSPRLHLVLALAGLALAGCSGGAEEAGPAPPLGTEVGQRAPALEGTTAAGEPFSLEDAGGSPAVLVFYQGAYCGLCRERLVRLQEHLPAYRTLGARVVALTPDPPAASAELARGLGLEFPVVSVESATLDRWGVSEPGRPGSRPGTFLLDARGEVLFRHLGRNAGDRAPDAGLITILERQGRE